MLSQRQGVPVLLKETLLLKGNIYPSIHLGQANYMGIHIHPHTLCHPKECSAASAQGSQTPEHCAAPLQKHRPGIQVTPSTPFQTPTCHFLHFFTVA